MSKLVRYAYKSLVLFAFLVVLSAPSQAGYNANRVSKIIGVLTYSEDYIYLRLENADTPPGGCPSAVYYHIPAAVAGKDILLARALTAYTTGEDVTIGYDNTAECLTGLTRYRVYRVG